MVPKGQGTRQTSFRRGVQKRTKGLGSRPGRFACLVRELHPVLPTHGNHELVNRHGSIDGDFAAKVVLDFVALQRVGRVVTDDLGQVVNSLRRGRWARAAPKWLLNGLNIMFPKETRGIPFS